MHLAAVEALLADAGRAAGQPQVRLRGRGGVGSDHLDAVARRPTASASPPTSRSSATPASSRATCRRSRSACAGIMYAADRRPGPVPGPPLRRATAATIENPANALAAIIAALKGPDGRIRIPGFYDDVVRPRPTPTARRSARCPSTRRPTARDPRRPGARRRDRLHDPRAPRRPPDARRQRDLGRLPGRGQQDDHPGRTPTPRSPAGSSPTRTPSGSSRAPAGPRRWRSPRPASASRSSYLGGGRPTPDARSITRPRGPPPGRSRRRSARPPLFIREGGSIPVAASFATILGLPVAVLGFTPPDGNFHAPNEWMDLANFEGGIRTLVRFWDELAAARPPDARSRRARSRGWYSGRVSGAGARVLGSGVRGPAPPSATPGERVHA